jgi:hypothetical protein
VRSFERADFSDQNEVLFAMLTACSAIVASRKRKLRELFAVATQAESLPQDAFANPDAPATTAAEWQFLQTSEILQCVPLYLRDFFRSILHFVFVL